jgi:GTP-binding protein EngB required for normal cell division
LQDSNEKTNLNTSAIDADSRRSPAPALLSSLCHVRNLLGELGAESLSERRHLQELEDRLASSRFHLAVLGQFKRGKSTLLNALIGEDLLPSAIVPVTSIPTFLSWGPKRIIRVVFLNGHNQEFSSDIPEDASAFLARYVTESANSKNHLGVARVEVEHPSSLLQKGVVLIDTPGIGSTFQHNTETTINFLSQCDAALFLISADPPITQTEIEFLKAIRAKVVKTSFLMNKVDYLSENERQMALDFFRTVLREQAGLDGSEPVFSISARQGLEARLKGDDSQWIESGMSEVENYLLKFLTEEKIHTLSLAVARKAEDIVGNVLLHLRLKQRSLTLPLEDLEQKLTIFAQKLGEVEHQRELTRDLLTGDQRRLIETLEQECAKTLRATQAELYKVLDETFVNSSGIRYSEEMLHGRLAEIVPSLFGEALSRVSTLVNQRMQEMLSSHQEKANALAETIRQTAAELFEIPYAPGRWNESLVKRHEPYWVTENWGTVISPVPRGLLERLLPRNIAIRRIKRWLQQDIEAVISRNVDNLQSATRNNIEDTFRRFSWDLDRQLEEVARTTLGAIQEAHTQRIRMSESIGQELGRLRDLETKLRKLQDSLSDVAA